MPEVITQLPASRQVDFEVLREATTRKIRVKAIRPSTQEPESANTVTLSVYNVQNTEVVTKSLGDGITEIGADTGIYEVTIEAEDDLSNQREHLAAWSFSFTNGSPEDSVLEQLWMVVPNAIMRRVPILRNQIDKARKSVDPRDELDFGYETRHCVAYLDLGTQIINAYNPITGFRTETFPFETFGKIQIDAATLAAMESQGLFAIDTDHDYSLGGNSMFIDHWRGISAFLDGLSRRFEEECRRFKQQFRTSGSILVTTSYGYAFGRFLSTVPIGFFSIQNDLPILLRKDGCTDTVSIGEYFENPFEAEALSVNQRTKALEWKSVYGAFCHDISDKRCFLLKTAKGRKTEVTEDHSLFTFDRNDRLVIATGAELQVGDSLISFSGGLKSLDESGMIVDEIKSKEETSHEFMYDIAVRDNENFFAGGLLTHNSRFGLGIGPAANISSFGFSPGLR